MRTRMILTALATSCVGAPSLAQNPASNADEIAATEITVERVADGLYVLFGVGGNIMASICDDGVLIGDTQFPGMVPKYRAAIADLGGGAIDVAIDTHWHYDHSDGNQVIGPDGTLLVAHQNSRDRMLQTSVIHTVIRPDYTQRPYAADALPVVTFEDRMRLYFNGEQIDLLHLGPAHTTGDAAVIFRSRNTVHLGDVFNNSGYPFIDANNGGDLNGMITFREAVLAELDEGATVVAGHGPVGTYADLERYITMLKSVRDKMSALIDNGATLEQVIAAAPTAEWDEQYGDPTRMIDRSYASLSR